MKASTARAIQWISLAVAVCVTIVIITTYGKNNDPISNHIPQLARSAIQLPLAIFVFIHSLTHNETIGIIDYSYFSYNALAIVYALAIQSILLICFNYDISIVEYVISGALWIAILCVLIKLTLKIRKNRKESR